MPALNAQKKKTDRNSDQDSPASRRALVFLLIFVSTALLANAIVGDRGLLATRAAKRTAVALETEIQRIQQENSALRERANALRTDPKAIEDAARDSLGLMREGELLILLHDGPELPTR